MGDMGIEIGGKGPGPLLVYRYKCYYLILTIYNFVALTQSCAPPPPPINL